MGKGCGRRTSSVGSCERLACEASRPVPGAGCADTKTAAGDAKPRSESAFATSTAAMEPKEWPKKANGMPVSSVGRRASITPSTRASRLVQCGSAWRDPRPGGCTPKTSNSAGSSQSRNADAEPPACGKSIRRRRTSDVSAGVLRGCNQAVMALSTLCAGCAFSFDRSGCDGRGRR